ncbi:MAG TPA: D-alanyl-D-alanine carboxypeptidase/D-alanyl-D-alanine-endopeptidase [Gemmatimonadaceae bacterium]
MSSSTARAVMESWRCAAAVAVAVACVPWAAGAQAPRTSAARSDAALAQRIQSIVERPEFRHSTWGVEFYSLDSGKTVYSLNGDKLFVPGSTTKLLTMGSALGLLGADYRFHTRVYRTGPITSDGTLDGDLVLVASGDANLSGRIQKDGTLAFENEDHSYDGSPDTKAVPGDPLLVIRDIAAQVRARGIRKISGRVLVDATLFPEGERELGTGVVISPIIVNDNLVDVVITPGAGPGAPVSLNVSPATPYVRFVNEATTGSADSQPHIRWSSDLTNPDGSHTVTVTGTMPVGKQAVLFSYAVPEPSRFAQVALVKALDGEGVQAALPPPTEKPDFEALAAAYTDANVVAEHVSPPLSEEVKVTLKVSQNLHASAMPYVLGAILAHDGSPRAGFEKERDFLQHELGLDISGASQGDGAGGSAHFTPAFMVRFLAAMAERKDFPSYFAALPVLGRDGTLWNIQTSSPAAGHVHAKTGTYVEDDLLNNGMIVDGKGLAGYLTTADGRKLAFAIYANNVPVSMDPDAITKIVGQAVGEVAAAGYEARP